MIEREIVKSVIIYVVPSKVKPDARLATIGVARVMDLIEAIKKKSLNISLPSFLKSDNLPVSVKIDVFRDRSFELMFKGVPLPYLLKTLAGVEKGSKRPGKDEVGEIKRADLNVLINFLVGNSWLDTDDPHKVEKSIAGVAKSMGIVLLS